MTTWEVFLSSTLIGTVEAANKPEAKRRAWPLVRAFVNARGLGLLGWWVRRAGEPPPKPSGTGDRFRQLVREYEREGYERYDAIRQAREDFARAGE